MLFLVFDSVKRHQRNGARQTTSGFMIPSGFRPGVSHFNRQNSSACCAIFPAFVFLRNLGRRLCYADVDIRAKHELFPLKLVITVLYAVKRDPKR